MVHNREKSSATIIGYPSQLKDEPEAHQTRQSTNAISCGKIELISDVRTHLRGGYKLRSTTTGQRRMISGYKIFRSTDMILGKYSSIQTSKTRIA